MMKTEKRNANVGERILITNPELTGGNYGKGDVFNVVKTHINTVVTEDNPRWIRHEEYEVIVIDKPKKSARITALESQVATLQAKFEALESAGKYPLTERFERESTSNCEVVEAILADIERKAKPTLEALLATYPTQSTSPNKSGYHTVSDSAQRVIIKTPNEQRADVIKRAKAFVARQQALGGRKVNYVVNADKRTVVALVYHVSFGFEIGIYAKGIAKCDPDDVFNADIGKAIALARALGVDVPVEFVKAVQPTEIVLGHRVYASPEYHNELVAEKTSVDKGTVRLTFIKVCENHGMTRILDDTDAVYE